MTNHMLKRLLDDYCRGVENPQPQFKLLGMTFGEFDDLDADQINVILGQFPDLRPKFNALCEVLMSVRCGEV